MMKSIIVLAFTFILTPVFSAPLIYTDVVSVDSASADNLYKRAKLWIAESFNSANNVIQLDDPESNTLVVKALMTYNSNIVWGGAAASGNINYTLKIFTKDNRYKYTLEDFNHKGNVVAVSSPPINFGIITDDEECPYEIRNTASGWRNKVWTDIKIQIADYVKTLLFSINKAMASKTASQDDW